MDEKSIYHKIANYCAFQERSLLNVKKKLSQWEVPDEIQDKILRLLHDEGYINQERYADSYTRGKINFKKWGKTKIKLHLLQNGLEKDVIDQSLNKISHTDYESTIKNLIKKKLNSLKSNENELMKRQKTIRFLLGKGFEYEVVKTCYDEVVTNQH